MIKTLIVQELIDNRDRVGIKEVLRASLECYDYVGSFVENMGCSINEAKEMFDTHLNKTVERVLELNGVVD